MAKKITNPENEAVENPATQPEQTDTEQPAPAPEPQQEEPEATDAETPEVPATPMPAPKAEKKSEAKETVSAIPDYIDRILKVNSAYPQLYIDPHGGTFTVNTPPALRGNTTLYANPYHKRP